MFSSLVPPRQVKIGDAAAFAGITPRTIRHYHEIGLLPEPERGGDDRRRYGYDDMIRLLWIRRMADAGIALDDIRLAFSGGVPSGTDGERSGDHAVAELLERLEGRLVAQEEELRQQRTAVRRMRTRGSRVGLLSDLVADRLGGLSQGFLRQEALDSLLITERLLGPAVAAIQASRFVALATHPGLQERSGRVDAAEEALDDTVAVDDPRVARVAAERHDFETVLLTAIEQAGLADDDEALLDSWDAAQDQAGATPGTDGGHRWTSAAEAVRTMPYDWSPARVRCMELSLQMGATPPAS